jgi:hypothetical protein
MAQCRVSLRCDREFHRSLTLVIPPLTKVGYSILGLHFGRNLRRDQSGEQWQKQAEQSGHRHGELRGV